ncbi:MAG: FmdB family zinc ribbon protein [Phycisphaerales bacterium]
MPTYDYECNACGHRFELFQSMSAPVKRKCPKCNKQKLERLIGTGAGIIFKGGGFYETDYRSESYRKAAEKESKAGSPAASESSSSSDSTPAKADTSNAKPDGAAGSTGEKAGAKSPSAQSSKPSAGESRTKSSQSRRGKKST